MDKNKSNGKDDASVFYELAQELHTQHKTSEALENIDKNIEINKKIDDQEALAWSLLYKGMILHERGMGTEKALAYFKECSTIFENLEILDGAGKALYNIGWIYRDQGKYDLALEYAKKDLALREKQNNTERIAWANVSIGWIYTGKKEFKLAENQFKKAIQIFEEIKDEKGRAFATRFFATSLKHNNKLNLAVEKFQESLVIFKKLDNKWQVIITLDELGEISEKNGEIKIAIDYYLQMLSLLIDLQKFDVLVNVQKHMIDLYLKTNQRDLAENMFDEMKILVQDKNNDKFNKKLSEVKKLLLQK
ncbi:MAG: tetratricopeptide repeat protein [Candidatus Heimdallarchaeota archaeon]